MKIRNTMPRSALQKKFPKGFRMISVSTPIQEWLPVFGTAPRFKLSNAANLDGVLSGVKLEIVW